MIQVFVVILNWNRKDDTLECLVSLNSINLHSDISLEVVVVDNGSEDGSVKALNNFKFKKGEFTILQNKANLGYTGGNNVGMRYALDNSADYVLVLNNDTRADKGFLNGLVETASNFPDLGALNPKIYFEKGFEFHKERYKKSDLGKVFWSAGGKTDWENVYGVSRGVDEVDTGQFEEIAEVDYATGACAFYSAKALKKVGLFDEKYFLYFEDNDLSQRLKRSGFKVLYTPHSKIWHKVSQSSKIGGDLNDYFITRNRLLFGRRYASLRTQIALAREATRFLISGRKYQKLGVKDYFLGNLGKGSWK